jgi:hypothetical protein
LVAALALTGLVACSSDDTATNPTEGAPQLPPLSSMQMDLSFFSIDVDVASAQAGSPSETLKANYSGKENFIQAAVRTFYVQLVIYTSFEAPVHAFAAAIHSVPQPQPDGSWLWTFIFVEDGVDYGIFLYGKPVGNVVEWRMEVSSNNPDVPLDHFVWFDGESKQDDSGGFWNFYSPEAPGESFLRLDWSNVPAGTHTLSITVLQGDDVDDTLVINEAPQASTIDYTDASAGETHNITWRYDGSGSLTVPDYNNGETACWDIRQRDTVCP